MGRYVGEVAADSTNTIRVRENRMWYALIEPCWTLLILEIREVFNLIVALGPIFSSQAKSWLAMVCPRVRLVWGKSRWVKVGKKPSMLEKWWGA